MMKISRCIALILAVVAAQPSYASPREPAIYVAADKIMDLAKRGDIKAQAQPRPDMRDRSRPAAGLLIEAAKWYSRAAVQGDGWAQFELGMLYNHNKGQRRSAGFRFVISVVGLVGVPSRR